MWPMRRVLFAICSVLLLAGCAHERGGTGDYYYSNSDYGPATSNGPTSDVNASTNQSNHIERSRQPEYPSETNPRYDRF